MAAARVRARARRCVPPVTAPVWSAATRGRSGSPSLAPTAGAVARSSSTPATNAKVPASPPAPAPSTCGSRRVLRPDKVFGRDGDDLTVTVPVSFSELALGSTLSVPTLDGKVGVRVPKGTTDGRILRVRGRGVPKRSGGNGDLLVTVKVAVPPNLEGTAQEALEAYAEAERSSGFNPRAGWAGNR